MAGEFQDQFSDDLKGHEAFAGLDTITDFGNRHIETLGKVSELDGRVTESTGKITDLEGRLANSIPRLTEKSTDDETAAYRKALGVPDAPTDYEFPKAEGIEHDEKTIEWFRDMAHGAGLTKDQASAISQGWDTFAKGLQGAMLEAAKADEEAASTALKEEWKADYDKNIKETERGYQAFEKVIPNFKEFLATETKTGTRIGNTPEMLKVFHIIQKSIGDDLSIPSIPAGAPKPNMGDGFMSIYKVPNPPQQ